MKEVAASAAPVVQWLKEDELKRRLWWVTAVLSAGILPLLCTWFPKLKAVFQYAECAIVEAQFLRSSDGEIVNIERHLIDGEDLRCIELKCRRYFFTVAKSGPTALTPVQELPPGFLQKNIRGISHEKLQALYGRNEMKLEQRSFWDIFVQTALHPFYIFQYFAVCLWCYEEYYTYSVVIIVITMAAVWATSHEEHTQLQRLRELARNTSNVDLILPDGMSTTPVPSSELVPGDRVLVQANTTLPCDSVLLSGRCVCDESMLTGESVPVAKHPLDLEGSEFGLGLRSLEAVSASVLYGGTKVVATQSHARTVCVCARTGFYSSKGALIASLLTDDQGPTIKFFEDALTLIFYMFWIGCGFYTWSAVKMASYGASDSELVVRFFDCITIVVPPALTACLSIATTISISRLSKRFIFVSDSSRVNFAGLVSVCAFDKTGTLTQEELKLHGVCVQVGDGRGFGELPLNQAPPLCVKMMATCHTCVVIDNKIIGDPLEREMLEATKATVTVTGGISHVLIPPPVRGIYAVVKAFEFSPQKLRSGVCVYTPEGEGVYFCKGSPEAVLHITDPSTHPENVGRVLDSLARRGLRVIALAHATLTNTPLITPGSPQQIKEQMKSLSQEDIEGKLQLQFYGFIFMSNELKSTTVSTIEALHNAKMHCSMITGDHLFTAVAIASECKLVDLSLDLYTLYTVDNPHTQTQELKCQRYSDESGELMDVGAVMRTVSQGPIGGPPQPQLAMTGSAMRLLHARESHEINFSAIVRATSIFARMKPADKKLIVESLMHSGLETSAQPPDDEESALLPTPHTRAQAHLDTHVPHVYVIFCGDGANDMSALKAATVGVSLCDAETSVAAPVTSRDAEPSAVIDVCIEGRASLVTAHVITSFMIMYAFIQLLCTCLMYGYGLAVGNFQYLLQDFFFTTVLGVAIAQTDPASTLSHIRPPDRFFAGGRVLTLVLHLAVFTAFQCISLAALQMQDWYDPFVATSSTVLEVSYSYETSVISFVALTQFMIASVVVSIGYPFRKYWYESNFHVYLLILQSGFLLYMLFSPSNYFTKSVLDFKPLPYEFGGELIAVVFGNLVCSYLVKYLSVCVFGH